MSPQKLSLRMAKLSPLSLALTLPLVSCKTNETNTGTAALKAESSPNVNAPVPLTAGWQMQILAQPVSYPESPLWHDGKVYFVEYAKDQVLVVEEGGGAPQSFWRQKGCGPAAVTALPPNSYLVACYDANSIVKLDVDATGSIATTTWTADDNGLPLKGTNDFTLDGKGGVYFTASGVFTKEAPVEGKVFHWTSTDAKVSINLVADGIHYANGLALLNGGKTLVVSEHLENRLLAFDIDQHTQLLGNRRILVSLTEKTPIPNWPADGKMGPDGIKAANDSELYVAQYGGGRILKVGLDGTVQLRQTIDIPYQFTDNVYVHGDDLYVSAVQDADNAPYPGVILHLTRAALTP